ncbi:hypothetical protein [Veronia pacifica]|uniref:Lipoprotein n=1 Tax=Veronia pacifica TaxID=1080227 RepID=A0A1C3ECA4_9GAMM|nr:hypothetical protein [Veronia pacifica]ODA30886.1 hypothetical protein A8L45_18920 [Veronia pacifica]
MVLAKRAALAVAISSALTLTACGGDSSSESIGTTDKDKVQVGGAIITALDGYLYNALLCADDNDDGKCTENEVIKDRNGELLLTDKAGRIDAEVSLEDENRLATHPRLVTTFQSVYDDTDVFTEDMDLPGQAMKAVTLRAPSGAEIISPITDLVSAQMETGLTQKEAEKVVIESLSGLSNSELSKETLYSDYIKAKEKGDTAQADVAKKLHKTAQILTETKANASSEDAFDKHIDDIVEKTVEHTKGMTDEELEDETNKPFVPVTDEKTDDIVENRVATFNPEHLDGLAYKVASVNDLYGDKEYWQDKALDISEFLPLVSDQDAEENGHKNTVSIANIDELKTANLIVEISDNVLNISRNDNTKAVSPQNYQIQLISDDIDAEGNPVADAEDRPLTIRALKTLSLTVKSYNHTPDVVASKQAEIQQQLDGLELVKGEQLQTTTLDLNDLFSDKDGDTLTLQVSLSLQGVNAEINGNQLTLSGTPSTPATDIKLTITATDSQQLRAESVFSLPDVKVLDFDTTLRDTLVGANKVWYRWTSYGNQQDNTLTATCVAFKFVPGDNSNSGNVFFKEGQTCAKESDVVNPFGTWSVNTQNGSIRLSTEMGSSTLSGLLNKDLSDETNTPHIVVAEEETASAVTRASSGSLSVETDTTHYVSTYYKGIKSANSYWNFNNATLWINGEAAKVFSESKIDLYSNEGRPAILNVSVNIGGQSCSSLGFEEVSEETDKGNSYIFSESSPEFIIFSNNGNYVHSSDIAETYITDTEEQGCAVKLFPYVENRLDVNPGAPLTIRFTAKDSANNEEFIINTFVDRHMAIQAGHDLNVDSSGLYFIHGFNVLYISQEDGQFWGREGTFDPESKTLTFGEKKEESSTFLRYQTASGKAAYQVYGSTCDSYDRCEHESFSFWSNDGKNIFIQSANDKILELELPFTYDEPSALDKLKELSGQDVSFLNTTWFINFPDHKDESGQFTFKADGAYRNDSLFSRWEDFPEDLPCLKAEGHTCRYEELNDMYDFDDEGQMHDVKWRWNPETPNIIQRFKDGRHNSTWTRLSLN